MPNYNSLSARSNLNGVNDARTAHPIYKKFKELRFSTYTADGKLKMNAYFGRKLDNEGTQSNYANKLENSDSNVKVIKTLTRMSSISDSDLVGMKGAKSDRYNKPNSSAIKTKSDATDKSSIERLAALMSGKNSTNFLGQKD